ncbi:MAG: hypothetical protein IJU69_07170 [Bacteroidales bacterium]|nr:hypothetical protein [Bacteroidales bacterium]
MKVYLVVLCLVALCVLALGVNIFFRGKDFPQFDVGSNDEMKRRGIRCFKDVDADMHKVKCNGDYSEACKDCSLYGTRSNSRQA